MHINMHSKLPYMIRYQGPCPPAQTSPQVQDIEQESCNRIRVQAGGSYAGARTPVGSVSVLPAGALSR